MKKDLTLRIPTTIWNWIQCEYCSCMKLVYFSVLLFCTATNIRFISILLMGFNLGMPLFFHCFFKNVFILCLYSCVHADTHTSQNTYGGRSTVVKLSSLLPYGFGRLNWSQKRLRNYVLTIVANSWNSFSHKPVNKNMLQ